MANVTGSDHGTIRSISMKLPSCLKNLESEHDRIAGTFNGIVLLVLKDMVLYNPLTGAFKIVPKPSFKPSRERYGFGYVTAPDDSKIIRLISDNRFYDDTIRCDVFNLRKGSWNTKSWRFSHKCLITQFAGTFLNGFLYWIARTKLRCFVVSLNVKEMIFSEIQLPFVDTLATVGTSWGRLHACRINQYCKFELWVMDMAVPENPKSWSKVLTLNAPSDFNIPLSIVNEGKVVLLKGKNQKQVAIYDWLKDSSEVYEVNAHLGCSCNLQAMEYVESLVSPSDLYSSKI